MFIFTSTAEKPRKIVRIKPFKQGKQQKTIWSTVLIRKW